MYKCEYCEKIFRTKSILSEHEKKHVSKSKKRKNSTEIPIVTNVCVKESSKENINLPKTEFKPEAMKSNFDKDLWTLFKFIRYYKTNNGHALAEPFVNLPLKIDLPDYYSLISKPISLSLIRQKIKSGDYSELGTTGLSEDMNMMFENCKSYNGKNSKMYKDACRLQKVLSRRYEDLQLENEKRPSIKLVTKKDKKIEESLSPEVSRGCLKEN